MAGYGLVRVVRNGLLLLDLAIRKKEAGNGKASKKMKEFQ
jgi:hypothetical protein